MGRVGGQARVVALRTKSVSVLLYLECVADMQAQEIEDSTLSSSEFLVRPIHRLYAL